MEERVCDRARPLNLPVDETLNGNNASRSVDSTRKTTKLNRAIVGASLEEIKKKRSQKPEVRLAQREAAARSVRLYVPCLATDERLPVGRLCFSCWKSTSPR